MGHLTCNISVGKLTRLREGGGGVESFKIVTFVLLLFQNSTLKVEKVSKAR